MMKPTQLKILTIGNSFSEDTMEHCVAIAKNLGIESIKLGNLYVGGCSIKQHYFNATTKTPAYIYYQNDGCGWTATQQVTPVDALKSEDWDYVTIQPGTGDGSFNSREESYEKLVPLLNFIKEFVPSKTKLAFNLTWVGEPHSTHPEMVAHNGNQLSLFLKIVETVKKVVYPLKEVDFVIPTGLAVQNTRTAISEAITRDAYHLSYDKGRFVAGLTFISKITGLAIDGITWAPDGVDEEFKKIAIKAVNSAIQNPFAVTKL